MTEQEKGFRKAGTKMLDRACSVNRQEFGDFFLSRFLGFEVSYSADECIVAFAAIPPLFNPQGTLHGGVLATALDISMGHLLFHKLGAGATLEMKVQYLSAASEGRVVCRARFLRLGRSVSFLESRAYREDGEIVAAATSTWKVLKRPSSEL